MYHNSLFLKFDLVENTEKHRSRMFYGTKVIFLSLTEVRSELQWINYCITEACTP